MKTYLLAAAMFSNNIICENVTPWQQDLKQCSATFEERFGDWDIPGAHLPRWPLQHGSKIT